MTSTLPSLCYAGNRIAIHALPFTLPNNLPARNDLKLPDATGQIYLVREITLDAIPDGCQLYLLREIVSLVSSTQFELLCRAYQLLEAHKNHRYCGRCATPTVPHPVDVYAKICPSCTMAHYPRVQPCVIVAITRGTNEILLAKPAHHTHPTNSLLAGYVEAGETLEQAIHREIAEEVGIQIKNVRYWGSQPWPYPSNIMIGFSADYDHGDIVLQADEIACANFFDFKQLPSPLPPKGSIARRMIEDIVGYTIGN